MGDKYCTKCGSILSNDSNFCPKCGAQQISMQQPAAGYQPRKVYNQPVYQQPKKSPNTNALLVVIVVLSSILLGVLIFGAYKLFFEPDESENSAFNSNQTQKTAKPTATPINTPQKTAPGVSPTDTPKKTLKPLPTQKPEITPQQLPGYSYFDIIYRFEFEGLTEKEVIQIFGEPNSTDEEWYGDMVYTRLFYDTFYLEFPQDEDGDISNCQGIYVFDTPSPVWPYKLEVGMDVSNVESAFTDSPFVLDYQEDDNSYWAYTDFDTGHMLFIDFEDDKVTGFDIVYVP